MGGQGIQKKDHPAPPSLTTTALNGAADTGENKGPTNDARVALRVVRRLTAPFFLFPSCSFHASMTPPPQPLTTSHNHDPNRIGLNLP